MHAACPVHIWYYLFDHADNIYADPGDRAAWSVGLKSHTCWDRGFGSSWGNGCLSVVGVVRKNCEKWQLASSCLSVCPQGTTRLQLDGFSWNFTFEFFFLICLANSVSLQSDKKTKTNTHLWQLGAQFFLEWEIVQTKFFFTHVLMNFRGFPPGCGDSVADFWGWDAHEARLRCPDDVSGDMQED